MLTDRERWDAKYAGARGREEKGADPFFSTALAQVDAPAGARALDLAAGTGRHAIELARCGWRASAWDVSPVGLRVLSTRARRQGVEVETLVVDLLADGFPAVEPFDLLCAISFHDAGLWDGLHRLVAPGGHAIVCTFTLDWPGQKPPAHLRLVPGQLAAGLVGLETVSYEEQGGRAGVLARKPG